MKHFFRKYYFIYILFLYTLYALWLIFRSSFVIGTTRYFSLFDDEMVSMRYAYNMAHGHGLVWNIGGQHVEGFTNPLWVLYMAYLHTFTIPVEKISLFIQLFSMVIMIANLVLIKKISDTLSHNSLVASVVSILLTALYFPLNNWTVVLGTEVGLLVCFLLTSIYMDFKMIDTKHISYSLFLLLGLGTLIRLDFIVPAVIIIVYLYFFLPEQRKNILQKGVPVFISFLVAQTVIRFWYYHDFLPNTYYLKMTGYPLLKRITRGIYVTMRDMNWVLIAIPVVTLYLSKHKKLFLLLILFLGQILYSIYVGGDAWEEFGGANRYVAVTIPCLFIALGYIYYVCRQIVGTKFRSVGKRYKWLEVATGVVILFVFNTASDNMLLYAIGIKAVPTTGENRNQVIMAKSLQQVTTSRALIGIVQSGVTPYFLPDRRFIDLLGKNDRVIAHEAAHAIPTQGTLQQYLVYWPGHMKWDYAYALQTRHPDIFGQVYPASELKFLQKKYVLYTSAEGYAFYVQKKDIRLRNIDKKKLEEIRL